MAKGKQKDASTIQLTRLKDAVIEVPIIGLTPVIPHRWSEKAIRSMPGHPDAEKVKKDKGLRTPEEEATAALYLFGDDDQSIDDRLAIPATAFKAAIVGACRFFEKPTMVECRQLIFVEGEGPEGLVRITGERELHEDLPRNANGSSDLRYRYYIKNWLAILRIRYAPQRINKESVVTLVDAAGRGGVCDWRPSAPKSDTGTHGTWRVDETKEIKNVRD